MVIGVAVGTFFSFLLGAFDPRVVDKAGPDWLWTGGRSDPVRGLYFRPDGSFRRYGRVALVLTVAAGCAALSWVLPLLP